MADAAGNPWRLPESSESAQVNVWSGRLRWFLSFRPGICNYPGRWLWKPFTNRRAVAVLAGEPAL